MEIKSITVLSGNGVGIYECGRNGVEEIINISREFENYILPAYECLDNKKHTIFRIENCPVVVEYKRTPLTKAEEDDLPF